MSFAIMNNNNVFAANNELFALPIISLSDTEDLNAMEFELFPECQQTPVEIQKTEDDFFLNSCGSRSVLKSKTGNTEVTRADSIESLTILSGQVKSIKKVKGSNKKASKKRKCAKRTKKVKKSKVLTHYHKIEDSEFTCQFRKEFMNVKPLKKVKSTRKFKFVQDENKLGKQLSTFPISYEMEYQQPQDGLEEEEGFYSYQENSEYTLQTCRQTTYQNGSKTQQSSNSGVTFVNLTRALNKSKSTNTQGGAACFETFKSLKVLSLVCSYMDSE